MAQDIPKSEQLALEILTLSRNLLLVNFRYLDRGLAHLPFRHAENISLATDGTAVYFDSWFVLNRFRQEQSGVTRDLLHMLLHCIFRHPLIGPGIDAERWDAACDIAVEYVISQWNSPTLYARRSEGQGATFSLLCDALPGLNAERIYHWLETQHFSPRELSKLREPFRADGHGLWYGQYARNARENRDIDLQKIWQDVSRRMQTELETMNRDGGSSLLQNLRRLNRTKYNYAEFLRRFACYGEVMKLSEEEFDQNFYTYGLELYGNVPLIEPLEYAEQKRIREFVIAIDTSGSVRGEIVQSFIQHTYGILHSQETFFSRINLYILQCDDRIQDAAYIQNDRDFEQYIQTMTIRGLGQTDFRPVFTYIEQLQSCGQLSNLQGLIYFTDGDGIFPTRMPNYETAFILNCEDDRIPQLPCWAVGIPLSQEEFNHDGL